MKLQEGNVFTPVCHSVHRRCLPHPPGRHPPRQTPPWADTPPGQTPPGWTLPWAGTPLPSACWDTPCPVHSGIHPPTQCMLGYTYPPCAVHAGIWSTSGWCTSYWNAFLFTVKSINTLILPFTLSIMKVPVSYCEALHSEVTI